MAELYRDYFDIDPEFFPAVNDSVIAHHPNLWEKFYPHETFVKLLKDLISCVSGKQHLSVWVEGEYGTGKSHAVLTLKRLLEADDETTKNYFDRFPDLLGNDLYNQLYSLKHQGKILVVHRYASSDISNEENLLFDVQDSIVKALQRNGYDEGHGSLGTAVIQWLSDSANKNFFNDLMKGPYSSVFGGDNVDGLVEKLKKFTDLSLTETMSKVMSVAKERGITALSMKRQDLQDWIRSVIRINQLHAIIFIWDEFTDFFRNNLTRLSGLQALVEMSATDSFYLIPVTHNVANLFPAKDKDWNVISQRFVQPFCNIKLPDNMAFKLMGKALDKKDDPALMQEWEADCDELYDRTKDARQMVKKKAGIHDLELRDVLPLHPYAALLLKNMASYYAGDVRSMFDFLVNDAGTDIHGFRWFIDNYGPSGAVDGSSDNALLTVDMLWDFFYEKGKELLENDVRRVLDSFGQVQNLEGDEPRIFKAVLLMQAIYERTGSSVEELAPSKKNIEIAFMGSDLEEDQPTKIAESLCRKKVLYQPPSTELYKVMKETPEPIDIVEVPFTTLVEESEVMNELSPREPLSLRYHLIPVSDANHLEVQLKGLINGDPDNRIHGVIAFAKDNLGRYEMGKAIQKYAAEERFQPLVFVDATQVPLGEDRYQQICDSKSKYEYWLKQKNNGMANQYGANYKMYYEQWRKSISQGEFILYWDGATEGLQEPTLNAMIAKLGEINLKRYPLSVESFADHATNTMWASGNIKSGALYGAASKVVGALSSAVKDLGDAWTTDRYWEVYPLLPISKIKSNVDALIEKAFQEGTNISIREIYDFLYEKPYGFLHCNQTAFMMGFLLRQYADGSYTCTDNIKSEKLTPEKLASVIEEYMKNVQTPSPKYKDKYIAKMTEEIQAFQKASATVFKRPINVYTVEDIRETVVRASMKRLPFPMLYLKYALDGVPLHNQASAVRQLIDLYTALANSGSAIGRSDTEIASDIGRLCMDSPGLEEDLASVLNDGKVIEGMRAYLATFDDGILPALGDKVGDGGKYMNRLKTLFGSVDDANWLWMKETGDEQIRSVIREYKIVDASNQIITKTKSYSECIYEWGNTCNGIHISYLTAANVWDDLGPFMEMLYSIKKGNELSQARQEKFLQLLQEKGEDFRRFYSNQEPIFAKACSYMLDGLDQSAVQEVFRSLNGQDLFTAEKKYYQKQLQETIQEWKNSQVGAQLLKLWKDSTNTDSPRDWSQKYTMPILCMVDEAADELTAKAAFDTINAVAKKGKPSSSDIEKAISFLQSNKTLLERLEDPAQREKAFRRRILDRYNGLLSNVNEVQAYLNRTMNVHPYDWLGVQKLQKALENKAQYEYTDNGCDRASAKIDQMDAAEAKRYLKKLIEDYIDVGIAILRDKG